ncbi:MAG TPA: type II CAAX endopeptidase family protein [Candidatus Acidoferrales bacterium]|nr:type II CAAX endopeptidase family protein [Candidatus Acidoferrales bacterium]
MSASAKSNWQLGLPCAFVVWAAVVVAAAFEGMRRGFHGGAFVIALSVASMLFGFELFLAAPRVLAWTQRALGGRAASLGPLVPLLAVLVYSLGASGNGALRLLGMAYCVLPAILLASSAGKSPGTWEDYAALVLIWLPAVLPVPVRLLYRLFPYPPPLTHTLAILLALSTAVAAFVMLRRLDGIGYAVAWGRGYTANFALHFAIFAAIGIPLGVTLGFLKYQPSLERARSSPLTMLGILFFTAWPEEFLFRGLLQNLLSRAMKNQWAGLIVASIVFGFSHIFHAPFPNWKYVLLATIAGLFYGHCWIRTRSLLPGALVHALVDISWHILFR